MRKIEEPVDTCTNCLHFEADMSDVEKGFCKLERETVKFDHICNNWLKWNPK